MGDESHKSTVKLDETKGDELHELIKYGNFFIIWAGFAFWLYQILRSAYLHNKKGGQEFLT